jgi:hypothetical protein
VGVLGRITYVERIIEFRGFWKERVIFGLKGF